MTNFVGLFQSQCALKKISHKISFEQLTVGFRCTLSFNDHQTWADASTKKEAKRLAHEKALAILVNETGYSERQCCPYITALIDRIGVENIPSDIKKGVNTAQSRDLEELSDHLFSSIESHSFQAYSEFKKILKARGYKTHQDGAGSICVWRCLQD
nr:MAG: VP5A [Eriocheir sinensis reovirus 1]